MRKFTLTIDNNGNSILTEEIEETMETQPVKTYPHKVMVQFFQENLSLPGERAAYADEDGITHEYNTTKFFRILTFCTLHPVGTADYYEGMAVLNPHDKHNPVTGIKEAFQASVSYMWQSLDDVQEMNDDAFMKVFFDQLLKKDLKSEGIFNHAFVLKVRLPWQPKRKQ